MASARRSSVSDPHDPKVENAEAAGTETHHEPHGAAMPHGAADDISDHGEDDHAMAALGPVDVEAWLAAALGVALGLVVALCLVIAVSL
jgi:hypothetical protein